MKLKENQSVSCWEKFKVKLFGSNACIYWENKLGPPRKSEALNISRCRSFVSRDKWLRHFWQNSDWDNHVFLHYCGGGRKKWKSKIFEFCLETFSRHSDWAMVVLALTVRLVWAYWMYGGLYCYTLMRRVLISVRTTGRILATATRRGEGLYWLWYDDF
jgi:hypothetical protein